MARQASKVARVVLWAVLGLCVTGAQALAQPKLDRSFEIQNYDPAVGPRQYFTLESTEMPGHLGYGVGLDFTFQDNPLAIYEVEGDKLKSENVVIDYQATFFLTGFFGIQTKGLFGNYLFKQIQFGLSLPLYLQSGQVDVSGYPLPSDTPSEVRGFAPDQDFAVAFLGGPNQTLLLNGRDPSLGRRHSQLPGRKQLCR